jgi:hypothetical protein
LCKNGYKFNIIEFISNNISNKTKKILYAKAITTLYGARKPPHQVIYKLTAGGLEIYSYRGLIFVFCVICSDWRLFLCI